MSFLQTNVSEKSTVQVAVRVRPINNREVDSDTIIDVRQNAINIIDPSDRKKKNFNFDYSFDQTTTQETVFDNIGEKVVSGAYAGYNCCIFAYGQSGSGKSFSVLGSQKDPGLIPRICQALFDRQATNNGIAVGDALISYKIELSYLEIYSEEVKDLLVKSHQHGGLKVRQHPELGPYVEGLSQVLVEDYQTIKKLIDAGNKERAVASTMLNDHSSRSHAICTLHFTQLIDEPSLGKTREVVSKVNLVDLAGSERVEVSGVTGINFKEAININKSLSTLGLVISKLASASMKHKEPASTKLVKSKPKNSTYDRYSPTTTKSARLVKHPSGQIARHSPKYSPRTPNTPNQDKSVVETQSIAEHVPFRDSVLTWILKESLGGNSKTFMLATISPSELNYNESLSTLRYAYNAKQIVNTVKVNEDPSDKLIRVLKGEIEALREQLSMKGADSTTPALELKQLKEELAQREELMKEKDKTWKQKLDESKRINQEVQEKAIQDKIQLELEYTKKLTAMNMEKEAVLRDLEQLRNNSTDKATLEEELAKKQAEFEKGRIVDTAVSLQEYYEKKLDAMRGACDLKMSELQTTTQARIDKMRDDCDAKAREITAACNIKASTTRDECDAKIREITAECNDKVREITAECNDRIASHTEEYHTKLAAIQSSSLASIELAKSESQHKLNEQLTHDEQKNITELASMKLVNSKLKEENARLAATSSQQTKQFASERMVLSRQIQQLQAKIHSLENTDEAPMLTRAETHS